MMRSIPTSSGWLDGRCRTSDVVGKRADEAGTDLKGDELADGNRNEQRRSLRHQTREEHPGYIAEEILSVPDLSLLSLAA